jgi:hypothetical protein
MCECVNLKIHARNESNHATMLRKQQTVVADPDPR